MCHLNVEPDVTDIQQYTCFYTTALSGIQNPMSTGDLSSITTITITTTTPTQTARQGRPSAYTQLDRDDGNVARIEVQINAKSRGLCTVGYKDEGSRTSRFSLESTHRQLQCQQAM